jgi:hypothetical protein
MNPPSNFINLIQLLLGQILKFINLGHLCDPLGIGRGGDCYYPILYGPFKQDIGLVGVEPFGDFGEDRLEWSAGVSEDWRERAVCLSYDVVLFVNVHDRLGVGEEVRVVLHFCRGSAVAPSQGAWVIELLTLLFERVRRGRKVDSRLTTGLILATFKTSSKSCGLKFDTPKEVPFNVPSSTRLSKIVQNSPILPLSGTVGAWIKSKSGGEVSLSRDSFTLARIDSGLVLTSASSQTSNVSESQAKDILPDTILSAEFMEMVSG